MSKDRLVQNVEEYLREVSTIKAGWPTPVLTFRGQKDKEWPLASSAERRLIASPSGHDGIPIQLFIEYHENLLKKCKLNNYDKRDGKQKDELELLADLQHHGAATCLLDFTRGALIALWFACEKSESDGKVFVVNTADEKTFLEITPADIKDKSIRDILEFKTRETDEGATDKVRTQDFWYWTPAHLNERIPAQHSLFLFGLPSSGKSKLNAEEIVIKSSNKEQIRRELQEVHDIHEESLFPDFVGFAYTQRHNAPYDTPDAEEYLRLGVEAQQRGQRTEAIEYYTKVLALNPDNHWAYLLRASAYLRIGEYARAIADSSSMMQLHPDFPEAYYLRGNSYYYRGEYDRAIHDLNTAIQLDPDLPKAQFYYLRGTAYYYRGEYDRAIHDLNTTIQANPNDHWAYLLRGTAYLRSGKDNLALQDSSTAIQLNPDLPAAYLLRGGAHFRRGEYDRAFHALNKAIELNPNYTDAIELAAQVATAKATAEQQQPLSPDNEGEEAADKDHD